MAGNYKLNYGIAGRLVVLFSILIISLQIVFAADITLQNGALYLPNGMVTDGRVGIGTLEPDERLEIVGRIKADSICIKDDCKDSWSFANSGTNPAPGVTIEGTEGRNFFKDTENSGRLRVGAAWGVPGIYSEDAGQNLLLGAEGGKVFIGHQSGTSQNLIMPNGKLGIGTTDPGSYKIKAVGDISGSRLCIGDICKDAWPSGLTVDSSGDINLAGNIKMNAVNGKYIIGKMADNDYWKIFGEGALDNGKMVIQTGDNGNEPITFEQYSPSGRVERMRIHSNGNVGIGIADPKEKLDVRGSNFASGRISASGISNILSTAYGRGTEGNAFNDVLMLGNGQGGWSDNKIAFWRTNNEYVDYGMRDQTPASQIGTMVRMYTPNGDASDSQYISFWLRNAEKMRIQGNGNVGIGTTNPSEKLEVAGNLKLSGAGSKIVFADGTQLTSTSGLSGGSTGGGWTDDGTTVRLSTAADKVALGTSTPASAGKLTISDNAAPSATGLNGDGVVLGQVTGAGGYSWMQSYGGKPLVLNPISNFVGINTNSPQTNLDVMGGIQSKDGSDRLFLRSYESSSLSEIRWGDDSTDRLRFFYDDWNGNANDKEAMTLLSNGNVGIGTTNPLETLNIVTSDGRQLLLTSTASNAALSLNSPSRIWSIASNNAGGSFSIDDNSASAQRMVIDTSGRMGIGATSPTTKLQIGNSGTGNHPVSSSNSLSLSHASDYIAILPSTISGDQTKFALSFGDDSNDMLTIGSFTSGNTLTVTGDGKVGIGTTTPNALLQLNTASTNDVKIKIGESLGGGGPISIIARDTTSPATTINGAFISYQNQDTSSQYVRRLNIGAREYSDGSSGGSEIQFWTSPSGGSPSYVNAVSRMTITREGKVGIGTATPSEKLEVAGNIKLSGAGSKIVFADGTQLTSVSSLGGGGVGGSGTPNTIPIWTGAGILGNSIITFDSTNNKIVVGGGTGKIDAGTVDPIYTINGKQYATYLPAMTGVKEETTGTISLKNKNEKNEYYYEIDFNSLEDGSDLWLFSKVTKLNENFDKMAVLLTPSFNGKVWYEKDIKNKKLIIYAQTDTQTDLELSYRLTAPRFDYVKWSNYADSENEGFNLDKEK